MQALPVAVLGFVFGMLHATDADHVVAISSIVGRERRVAAAVRLGALWGVGHTLTVFVVGGAIVVFGLIIPPRLGLATEFAVAVMLVLLGIVSLARLSSEVRQSLDPALADGVPGHTHTVAPQRPHLHAHAHGDYVHTHVHVHGPKAHGHGETPPAWLDRKLGRLSLYQALRPVAIGVVHGLAGSAAIALLVLAQIREPLWALAYLLLFGAGTLIGMMLVTSAVALPFTLSRSRLPNLHFWLQLAAGLLSLGLGLYLGWQAGVVDGLFGANPNWSAARALS